MNFLRRFVITGAGTGYLPIAPGTWGSAGAVLVYLAVVFGSGGRAICVNASLVVLCLLASIGCVAFGRFAETAFGRKDPSECTVDEWAGQAVSLLLLPLGGGWSRWLITAAAAFFAFRFFDVLKPPPIRKLEKLPYGWGVLLDDILAGVYANLVCQIVLRVILRWT